jgi:hypothetical protein
MQKTEVERNQRNPRKLCLQLRTNSKLGRYKGSIVLLGELILPLFD